MPPNISQLTLVALQAALKAGEILRKGFGTSFEIQAKKGSHDLVTACDKASELCIIETIKERFPNHSFLAEESGYSAQEKTSVLWIIDPLDGTFNFARNIPLFAISIAALIDGETKIGVIYHPLLNELFVAEKGQGAYLNGAKLSVSSTKGFKNAIGATSFPDITKENLSHYLEQFVHLASLGSPVRDLGSAALELAYVAAGRLDAYWHDGLYPWDIAAGKLLIEESGGSVTDFRGDKHIIFSSSSFQGATSILATNGLLHKELLGYF